MREKEEERNNSVNSGHCLRLHIAHALHSDKFSLSLFFLTIQQKYIIVQQQQNLRMPWNMKIIASLSIPEHICSEIIY